MFNIVALNKKISTDGKIDPRANAKKQGPFENMINHC